MTRHDMIDCVGVHYHSPNMENDEYSYVQAAGSKAKLREILRHEVSHTHIDLRFTGKNRRGDYVILIECKDHFVDEDKEQLQAYVEAESALNKKAKIIAILADTAADSRRVKVWKQWIDDEHLLKDESVLDSMEHYQKLFLVDRQNNRAMVMQNTYKLNETLHKMDIDEAKRSQFVGTCLLFVKDQVEKHSAGGYIDETLAKRLEEIWKEWSEKQMRQGITDVLENLLGDSENKNIKVKLLQRNVLNDQKVRALTVKDWINILKTIMLDILRYIEPDSSEGQDILNLFFITFNKYVGKADKNQAFTPDHITDFMAKLTEIGKDTHLLDITCGSGSFLVQGLVKELNDCRKGHTEAEQKALMKEIKKKHIFGIEIEEKAFGLATTNMLIHGDGNSNIILGSCFDNKSFIIKAKPHVILMNPPYNAKPRTIPDKYKTDWGKAKDGKEDPTKGLVFVKYLSDIAIEAEWIGTKLAALLPMSAAIGTSAIIADMKSDLLKYNTLEAVFSLPAEIFYPGSSVHAVCMLFTLNKPHFDADGKPNKNTFFGYYKDDGFKKRKKIGRMEQFDADGNSIWAEIEKRWLSMYHERVSVDGLCATAYVTGDDEWLCEAYMKTDYSKLTEADFQKTVNNYVAYLIKTGHIYGY